MRSYFPEEINVIQPHQPLGIVDHHGLAFGKINKAAHLLLKTIAVVLDDLRCHHGTHVGTA